MNRKHELLWVLGFVLAAVVTVFWFFSLEPGLPSNGPEPHEPKDAVTLVRQAIVALEVPQPNVDLARDKIEDALGAPETQGVDLSKVRAAGDALDRGNTEGALLALRQSIGSAQAPGAVEGPGTGEPVPRAEDGINLPTTGAFKPKFTASPVELGLLAAGVAFVLVGGFIVGRA